MRLLPVVLLVLVVRPAAAQIQSRPTDPPLVTAVNESWYRLREPIRVAGELYYPAGAVVFFDGNTMVRTAHYNGLPLYADATVEPFSMVLVPAGRGLMQPYERLRRGDLAGTTGSRVPSFPGEVTSEAAAPPALPAPPAAPAGEPGAVGTAGIVNPPWRVAGAPIVSLRSPVGNDGVWIPFLGEKWVSDGAAVRFDDDAFTRVGEYGTFPVFARRGLREDVIYLPTRAGLVAPYRLKE